MIHPGISLALLSAVLFGVSTSFAKLLLGAARTEAYFSLAPFVGAVLAVFILGEPLSATLLAAASLMGIGLWLHLSERHGHDHDHAHEAMAHEHRHRHDEHHQHEHVPGVDFREPHSHWHRHQPMIHRHPHYPDLHHRHGHTH